MKHIKLPLTLAVLTVSAALAAGCSHPAATTTSGADGTAATTAGGETQATTAASQQEAFDYSTGLTAEGYFEGVTASDYITLPEYKGISISSEVLTASEDDLNSQIDSILSNYVTYEEIKDRAAADGDTLNIDYIGKVDGEEFEGGSTDGAGTTVTIGETSYIDDFIEQLIGHTPGETFDIEVTFPEVYESNPDLQGKDAVFTVTVNYIHGDEIIPELSDEIAADYGFTTVDELKADIADWLVSTQKSDYMQTLLSGATCKQQVPESVLNYVIDSELAQYTYYADLYGLDLDGFLAAYSEYDSKDAYIEANQEAFEETAIYYLALQAIAETEQLSVDAQTLEDSGYADYVESYGEPYVKMILLQETVVPNFIFDHAAS